MKKTAHTKKPLAFAVTALLACLVVGVGVYIWRRNVSQPVSITPASTRHFAGPTAQEKAEAAAHKDELVQQAGDDAQNQDNGQATQKVITPVLTDASQNGSTVRVAGYVSGVLEDDGTCSFVLTKGSLKITKTTKAFANVSTTQCAPLTLDRAEFQDAGQWQVTLAYNSVAARGMSQAQLLAVQ